MKSVHTGMCDNRMEQLSMSELIRVQLVMTNSAPSKPRYVKFKHPETAIS